MFGEEKRHKARSEKARISQAAIAAVMPFRKQIQPWQVEIAHLTGLGSYAGTTAAYRAAYLTRAQALLGEVQMAQGTFCGEVNALPDEVAAASQVQDVTRALENVIAGLSRVMRLLTYAGCV